MLINYYRASTGNEGRECHWSGARVNSEVDRAVLGQSLE